MRFCNTRAVLLLLLVLFILMACSCSGARTLKVYSTGLEIDKLKSEEFSIDTYSALGRYSVNIINEKLYIEKDDGKLPSMSIAVDYGYYVGVNVGEFGGWVVYCPHNESFQTSGVLVMEENCVGFVKIDNVKVLLLTGKAHITTDIGKLYMLEKGVATELFDFKSSPLAFTWNEDTLYIVTTDKLYSYKLDEAPVVLTENDEFGYKFSPLSMVKLGDSIYCGGIGGVYEYCLDTGKEYWYPIK